MKRTMGGSQELRKVMNHNIQQIFFENDCRAITPKTYKKNRNVIRGSTGANWLPLWPKLHFYIVNICSYMTLRYKTTFNSFDKI